MTRSPGGVHVRIAAERDVERVVARVHALGGSLVSVQQTRRSLEEFFLAEVGADEDRASETPAQSTP